MANLAFTPSVTFCATKVLETCQCVGRAVSPHKHMGLPAHHLAVKSTDTVHSTKETQRRTRKAAKGVDEDGDTPLLDGVEEPEARDG